VGPRPLLPQYLERYSPEQRRRHDVKPGITGWAQIHGRNALGWPERLAHDVWYVDHWSLALDLHILARTLGAVFARRGISASGSATMPEFHGDVVLRALPLEANTATGRERSPIHLGGASGGSRGGGAAPPCSTKDPSGDEPHRPQDDR